MLAAPKKSKYKETSKKDSIYTYTTVKCTV